MIKSHTVKHFDKKNESNENQEKPNPSKIPDANDKNHDQKDKPHSNKNTEKPDTKNEDKKDIKHTTPKHDVKK